jgi:hypothetical protein
MDVVERRCLVRQLRGVEIVDLMRAGIVEQVENVEPEPRLLRKFIADPQIAEGGGSRCHAVVLDQRPAAEIAEAQCPEPGTEIRDRSARGGDHIGRAGNVAAGMAGLGIGGAVVAIGISRAIGSSGLISTTA